MVDDEALGVGLALNGFQQRFSTASGGLRANPHRVQPSLRGSDHGMPAVMLQLIGHALGAGLLMKSAQLDKISTNNLL